MLYTDNRQNIIEATEKLVNLINEVCNVALTEEEVNEGTRVIDKVTDVLSFPMHDYSEDKVFKDIYKNKKFDKIYLDGDELVLGDMVLSLERAKEQSIEYNHSFEREVCYLVVHSILHLLGYDHMCDKDKVKMRKREEEILEKLNITR